jgi:hypothetical protein
MLTITGRALGRKQPLFADFSMPVSPEDFSAGESPTLRSLLTTIVREQVRDFEQRQAQREFLRVLTQREIDAGAERGKIESGESAVGRQTVDPEQAIATALTAFEDGLFLVAIDGQEYRELERQVFLQPDSRLTIIRLTLLAGG